MKLYIDSGTGSMLFAILIGVIGAVNYLLKNWIVKLRFFLTGSKKVKTNAHKRGYRQFLMQAVLKEMLFFRVFEV